MEWWVSDHFSYSFRGWEVQEQSSILLWARIFLPVLRRLLYTEGVLSVQKQNGASSIIISLSQIVRTEQFTQVSPPSLILTFGLGLQTWNAWPLIRFSAKKTTCCPTNGNLPPTFIGESTESDSQFHLRLYHCSLFTHPSQEWHGNNHWRSLM